MRYFKRLLVWQIVNQAFSLVFKVAFKAKRNVRLNKCFIDLRRRSGFYEYYQIGAEDEDDDTDSGSEDPKGVIQTGMHSPWGIFFQIIKETGWSLHYVLWKISRTNLMLMMADRSQARYGKKDDTDQAIEESGSDLLNRFKANKGK